MISGSPSISTSSDMSAAPRSKYSRSICRYRFLKIEFVPPFRYQQLNELSNYMTNNQNRIPPGAEYRAAKLQETHFDSNDASDNVLFENVLPKVKRGLLALHENHHTMFSRANCETAKILSDENMSLISVDEYPSIRPDLLKRLNEQARMNYYANPMTCVPPPLLRMLSGQN